MVDYGLIPDWSVAWSRMEFNDSSCDSAPEDAKTRLSPAFGGEPGPNLTPRLKEGLHYLKSFIKDGRPCITSEEPTDRWHVHLKRSYTNLVEFALAQWEIESLSQTRDDFRGVGQLRLTDEELLETLLKIELTGTLLSPGSISSLASKRERFIGTRRKFNENFLKKHHDLTAYLMNYS